MDFLKQGDKVHYFPKPGMFVQRFENGIVGLPHKDPFKRNVVFYCLENWDKYMNYPSQEVFIENLKEGWVTHSSIN